jgi:hypothetical protein
MGAGFRSLPAIPLGISSSPRGASFRSFPPIPFGISAVPITAIGPQAGFRSMLAFWLGGTGILTAEPPIEPPIAQRIPPRLSNLSVWRSVFPAD